MNEKYQPYEPVRYIGPGRYVKGARVLEDHGGEKVRIQFCDGTTKKVNRVYIVPVVTKGA